MKYEINVINNEMAETICGVSKWKRNGINVFNLNIWNDENVEI